MKLIDQKPVVLAALRLAELLSIPTAGRFVTAKLTPAAEKARTLSAMIDGRNYPGPGRQLSVAASRMCRLRLLSGRPL